MCFSGNVPLLHMSTQPPGTSLHVISFTRPPCVSTASDKRWGEKAWVQGFYSEVYSISQLYTSTLLEEVLAT